MRDDQEWLSRWLAAGRERFAQDHGLSENTWRGAVLAPEDARGIYRAVDAGLVSLTEDGLSLVTSFNLPKRYRVFRHYDGGAVRPGRAWTWSWHEMFCQISFACELVLDWGWSADQVALEVDRLDVAAGINPVRAPALLAEAKLTAQGPAGLEAMLQLFKEMSGGSPALISRQARDNSRPKYEGLLRLRPTTFVAVAPGVRRWFDVAYTADGRALLAPAGPGGGRG